MATLAAGITPEAKRDQVLFGLMLLAGLRLGSALALETTDVDLARGEVLVRKAKGDRPLRIILARAAVDLLRGRIAEGPSGPLFVGPSGRPISSRQAQRRFRMWAAEAEIRGDASPHSLRHAFAAKIYDRTGDIAVVQRALGHRSITSTLVYAYADESRLRSALSKACGS